MLIDHDDNDLSLLLPSIQQKHGKQSQQMFPIETKPTRPKRILNLEHGRQLETVPPLGVVKPWGSTRFRKISASFFFDTRYGCPVSCGSRTVARRDFRTPGRGGTVLERPNVYLRTIQ